MLILGYLIKLRQVLCAQTLLVFAMGCPERNYRVIISFLSVDLVHSLVLEVYLGFVANFFDFN